MSPKCSRKAVVLSSHEVLGEELNRMAGGLAFIALSEMVGAGYDPVPLGRCPRYIFQGSYRYGVVPVAADDEIGTGVLGFLRIFEVSDRG